MNENAPSALAIVRARLPYVDRRALSEAWFSALHLAGEEMHASSTRPRAKLSSPHGPAAATRGRHAAPSVTSPKVPGRLRASARFERAVGDVPRTGRALAQRSASANVLETSARSYVAHLTSLTLGGRGGRVQLLLRREGAVLHVVALCRPEVADAVRRALARADAYVRLRGDVLHATVNETFASAAST